jgi:hypothetical protein
MIPPVNIFSGSDDMLGAALTNPTQLSVQKGKLEQGYPVVFNGKRYPDAETAYQILKSRNPDRDALMVDILVSKFKQHGCLATAVRINGGISWLESCEHTTFARSESAQAWEGKGRASRFIRNLIQAYELYEQGHVPIATGQHSLF